MEGYKCRTCLKITEEQICTQIIEYCLDKSIKQSIIQLVPEMESTLMDSEVVCNKCLKTLRCCMNFINRCLKIESDVQENITNQLEALNKNKMDNSENHLTKIINLDHDYFGETKTVSFDGYKIEYLELDCNKLDDFELNVDVKMKNTKDEIASMSPLSKYTQETNFNDTTQDDKIKDEYFLRESSTSLECEICKETFIDIDSLNKHKIAHDFTCEICTWSFMSKRDLATHKKLHAPFICDKCGRSFTGENQRNRHQVVHTKKRHICEVCGKICASNSALDYHKISHVQERLFMCDKCPNRYKCKYNLQRHVQEYHDKTDQHQCQKCGILVRGRQTYAKHYRLVHLQLKPFVCDVCGREFGRKDYLQKHMYYHTGEPRPKQHRNKIPKRKTNRGKPPKFGIRLKDPGTPVNCKICGKLILSVHLLKSHLQSHVKIKRHKCSYCELTFTLSNNRDRHQRIHEADPEKKFRCNICWKKMKTEEELEHHIVGHYNRPPQHSCDICGEKFHRKYLLDNHHLHKHTDPGDIERAEKEIVIDNLLEYAHPNDMYDYK